MRISERGQITIPKQLRDRFGMNPDVEVEITPTEHGLLIQKRTASHPVERVYASWAGAEAPTTTSKSPWEMIIPALLPSVEGVTAQRLPEGPFSSATWSTGTRSGV